MKVKLTKNSPEILESWRKPVIQVVGMTCIRLTAPFCDEARNLPPLSTCITVPIQLSGTPKRLDASVKDAARAQRIDRSLDVWPTTLARHASHRSKSKDDAKTAMMHAIVPRDRKACHCARGCPNLGQDDDIVLY